MRGDGTGWKSSGNRSCLVMRKGRLVGTDVQSGEGVAGSHHGTAFRANRRTGRSGVAS